MSKQTEALKLALDFVQQVHEGEWPNTVSRDAVESALRQALEQPAPAPAQPLTGQQIYEHFRNYTDTGETGHLLAFTDGVRFAEAAHGITKGKE